MVAPDPKDVAASAEIWRDDRKHGGHRASARDVWNLADALVADPSPEVLEAAARADVTEKQWKAFSPWLKSELKDRAAKVINAYRKAIGATA